MKSYEIARSSRLILLLIYTFISAIFAFIYLTKSNAQQDGCCFENPLFYLNLVTTLCFIVLVHKSISSNHKLIVAFGFLFLFLFLSEISYFIFYGEMISEGVLDSIIETNSQEVMSMTKQALIIIGPAFITTFLIAFILKKIISVKFNVFIPLSLYILMLLVISLFLITNSSIKAEIKRGDYKSTAEIVRRIYPAALGNLSYLFASYTSTDIYSNTHEIEKFNKAILLPPSKPDNDLIVFIMGESSLVTRYSAYGYHKQTTPFMTNIFSQNGGCIISNSHSAAAFTRDSIPMTLSFNVPESDDNLFDNKSIIEMAKFNHYKTYWLASAAQQIQGTFNTKFGFIARKSEVITFSEDSLDINLSQSLEDMLQKDNSPKKFIFVHLRGSHQPYTKGYDEIDKQALPDAEAYDLTIHHTDRTIKALYDVINKYSNNYTIIYTSDHGEIVNVGHGIGDNIDQFLIPFMFISTNQRYNCQFIESFRGSDGYLSGLMNKYILSNLLGYEIDQGTLDKEKNNDRVFMPNSRVMPFSKLLNKH
ncbi:MAG: sulfatase-like hydrolase/transferase [Gilliamella sp.]|uniref:sulfatase-like hydrolase/transferase n=2 Tax=Gilliamella sp. TaxID=1891236 RepID=UPI0025E07C90|nr:sulfatase-like hydrolase/transferase [Gilliamella sp.]MCO6538299.1 sulfatase-like hydrolase/transferase [Gilliamella sp.]